MKVTTILGSPKKKGNTAKVLGMFEAHIAQDHEVERINIADCNIKGCLGCYACQKKPDEFGCVQKDDVASVFERMMNSDAIVFAMPLYCWSFPSQLKALFDRYGCIVKGIGGPDHKSLVEGKNTALLVTCGGPVENNADLIQENFDRLHEFSKCNIVGKYVLPFCTTPEAIGDEGSEIANKMVKDIVGG